MSSQSTRELPVRPRAFSYHVRLGRVRDYVRRNLASQITLADAASVAGMESNYFSRFFKKKTGVGFSAWLNTLRTAEAAHRLATTNTSVGDIADAVGYRDIRTFERNFKKHFGVPPKTYQARIRQILQPDD